MYTVIEYVTAVTDVLNLNLMMDHYMRKKRF